MPPNQHEINNGRSAEITQAIDMLKADAEKNGFSRGAQAKELEYMERVREALAKRKKGDISGEDPDGVKGSLEQFAHVKYEQVQELANDYKMPATFEWISPEAKPNYSELAEYALVTRAVPEIQRYALDRQKIGDMTTQIINGEVRIVFGSVPGLAFAPDKLLAGCLTSKDKKTLFYPHFDQNGKLNGTSGFEASKYQFYMIERTARELMAKKGELAQLYPDKVVKTKKWGETRITQSKDGKVVTKTGSYIRERADALLDFPMTEQENLDIFYGEKDFYASYNHETKGMVVGDMFLDHMSDPEQILPNGVRAEDVARMTARHELNHAVWDNISDESRKKIVDLFQPNDPNFIKFLMPFIYDKNYRDAAIAHPRGQEASDKMVINLGNKQIAVSKEYIVNELIAYATWDEVISEDTMNKINGLNDKNERKNPMQQAASACLNGLPARGLEEMEKHLLIRRGALMKQDAEKAMEPFILGTKILAAKRNNSNP